MLVVFVVEMEQHVMSLKENSLKCLVKVSNASSSALSSSCFPLFHPMFYLIHLFDFKLLRKILATKIQ